MLLKDNKQLFSLKDLVFKSYTLSFSRMMLGLCWVFFLGGGFYTLSTKQRVEMKSIKLHFGHNSNKQTKRKMKIKEKKNKGFSYFILLSAQSRKKIFREEDQLCVRDSRGLTQRCLFLLTFRSVSLVAAPGALSSSALDNREQHTSTSLNTPMGSIQGWFKLPYD